LVYILTSTKTILETEIRAQESRSGDNVVAGLLALKLKSQLLAESYDEQQQYLHSASIASYISLNKLDQRNRYKASVSLHSINGNDYSFTKGSSSSGLGYALALFETWWNVVLKKQSKFAYPVFATGEILTSGAINKISYLNDKLDAVCTYVESNKESFQQFYICFPSANNDEISESTREAITNLGGILLPANRLQELLCTILGNDYDGDPLGRWEPFKGLNSFDYEDSVRFFGREKDVARLYDDLKKNKGLLIIAGASGSGKSSLVKAGLIPRIEQDNVQVHWAYTTPSTVANKKGVIGFVFEQLITAWALEKRGLNVDDLIIAFNRSIEEGFKVIKPLINDQTKKCLLYLDQYEEVFSKNYLNIDFTYKELNIIDKISSEFEQLDIVLALRNEYLGKLLENQALLSPVISNVSSPSLSDDWYAIIHEQAAFSGINFEHDDNNNSLDKIIIAEALQTQYALPMVEFLLEQLYQKAIARLPDTNTLLFEDYEQMGGLSGAIAYRAQVVLDKHNADNYLIDSFFENFVGLNTELIPYARHVDIEALKSQDLHLYTLVLGFIDANLIVYVSGSNDSGVLKLSHDSLFSHWQKLQEWIESFKDYLLWRNSIDGLYQRWCENNNKNKIYLLKDKRLLKEGFAFIGKKILKNNILIDYVKSSKAQKKRTAFNMVSLFLIIPLLIGSFFYWDNNRLKIYNYEEIGKKWEVPFGINEISDAQKEKMNYHYSLEYQGGVLRNVKKLNSVGNLYSQKLDDDVALWEYRYSDTGKVDEVIKKTRSGKTAAVDYYQFAANNTALLGFSKSIQKIGFFNVFPKNRYNIGPQDGKSTTSRKLLEFYDNGLLKKISYQDPYGNNTTDYEGYYGKVYEYIDDGLVKSETELNKNLEPILSSTVYYEYDANNRKSSELKGQKNNLSEQRIVRDSWSNVIEQSFFYNLHPTAWDSLHKIKFLYDQQGFLVELKNLDLNDNLTNQQAIGIAKEKYQYDRNGNLKEISYFGKDDQLIYDKLSGYALGQFKFNDKNQLIESSSFGILKEPIPIESNVFSKKFENDIKSKSTRVTYFGKAGEPVLIGSLNAHRIDSKYNQYGQLIEQRMYGVDNKPKIGSTGVFLSKQEYDSQGNVTKRSDFGINEEPIINKDGFHAMTKRFDEKGNVIEEANYDTQGKLTLSNEGVAIHRMKYNDFGNQVELSFFDQFDKPTLNKDGVAKVITNYYGDGSSGRVSGFEYYGTIGEPILNEEGVHRQVLNIDSKGILIGYAYYGINNELVTPLGEAIASLGEAFTSTDSSYHSNGMQKTYRAYYKDGSYNETINDADGNTLSFSFYDKNQNPILGFGDFSNLSKVINKYDAYGNVTERVFFDEKGQPGTNKPGFSKAIYLKDKNNVLTHVFQAYDIDGNIIPSHFSKHVIKITDKVEDRKLWEYLKSLNTKAAFQLYLNLVEDGLFKKVAISELNNFSSTVKIKSLTEGAKILLNNKYIAYQEVVNYLKPGDYVVAVKKNGYTTYTKNLVVKENDEVNISIELEKDSSSWDKEKLISESDKGNVEAQKNLGNKYLDEEDFTQAMKWYKKAADQGYAPAMHNIGYLYETAKGVTKDLKTAYQWYLKAANNGFALSQFRLGEAYFLGDLVIKDDKKSIDFYHMAAEQGNTNSQYILARYYFKNRDQSTRPSIESIKSFNYTKLVALQGVTQAYRSLALWYESSVIEDFDLETVAYWYEKAFNENDEALAALVLGEIYSFGDQTEIDFEKAMFWYEKAALKGRVDAASKLARFYFESTSFFRDREKGIFWLQKAAELGDHHAIKNLESINKGLGYLR
jgi:TPR repeat protein